jgi:hypothetical protein
MCHLQVLGKALAGMLQPAKQAEAAVAAAADGSPVSPAPAAAAAPLPPAAALSWSLQPSSSSLFHRSRSEGTRINRSVSWKSDISDSSEASDTSSK